MKAFSFDQTLIDSYSRFSRSFTKIRAEDLAQEVTRQYDLGRFWPDALLSFNPRYQPGPTVDALAASGDLDADTAKVFAFDGIPMQLHRHQAQAIAKAGARQSFVVTTGTSSGKSVCFFVPIVDSIVRARKRGEPPRTRAIVIYPMNALANSQLKEIDKFIAQSGLPEPIKPVVRRYTGQESQPEREAIAKQPPDILLTNFMMAELLLTRQDATDSHVIENASGLEFIVLDELHTYRGRQGADVAILVRRLRDRCCPEREPICIGTSATMASEGSDASRAQVVADFASRLFGAAIGVDAIIDESLKRVTDAPLKLADVRPALAGILTQELPDALPDRLLQTHPLAVWVELALGLDDAQTLKRKRPMPFGDAVKRLATDSGVAQDLCRIRLEQFLTRVSLPETMRGGSGRDAFLAFKLHRFFSGAGEMFATLTSQPRHVLLDAQLEDPAVPGHRLYPTRFCRVCGQEVHVVTRNEGSNGVCFLPRQIDDTPRETETGEDHDVAGYLVPTGAGDPNYAFTGEAETYPEDWREERKGVERLRANRKARQPLPVTLSPDGRYAPSGQRFWFIPGRFGFCPCCLDQPSPTMRERSKLAGLSGEGRSSATTLLVSAALEWMGIDDNGVPAEKRKLLSFTDNRQDAALQAGHFNDFLFVSLLRGAILRAVLDAGTEGLSEDEFGLRVVKALGFTAENKAARAHWMLDPDAGAVVRVEAQRALAKVLAHRVWTDLRRGWRYTNPSLAVLKLIEVDFLALDEISQDSETLSAILPELGALDLSKRRDALHKILMALVEGLAIGTEALDPMLLDAVANKSRNLLRDPWAFDHKEKTRSRATLFLQAPGRARVRLSEEQTMVRAGHNSRLARAINRQSVIGAKLNKADYLRVMTGLLELMSDEGLIMPVAIDDDLRGWQLSPVAVRLIPGEAIRGDATLGNSYFHDHYRRIATELKKGHSSYWGLEGREHTAQVNTKQREWREWRFRFEDDDRAHLSEHQADFKQTESNQFLPALFCSPTMELGIDISALNTVYLRNVPPTPANYVQRAGRAGRSGQAANIVTYCAAQSPHDQYFFARRQDMVAGIVRPPALDITNQELVRSHLHAIWLAETRLALSADIPEILRLDQPGYPLQEAIHTQIQSPDLVTRAKAPMQRVLDQILASVPDGKPVWMGQPQDFVHQVASEAPTHFDRAFKRWRELYQSARTQLQDANERSLITGLSGADRRRVKAAQMQASDQIAILEQGKATNGSDFYSYRYLATEGFLPGYNFPRLPLYAFIPAEGKNGVFLQRARFLAISEFGPRSLIYHEGRAYRVMKAKLATQSRTGDGSDLATWDLFICSRCGACHDSEVECCHACAVPMASEVPVKRTLRIDNVEAMAAERITANDEERVRQGFEIQTVFAWPRRDGAVRITEAELRCQDQPLFTLQYANSAEISRINKGLKRRKNQTELGFHIDPRTGYWAKGDNEDDPNADLPPDEIRPVRVVPIVRDHKNALLFRLTNPGSYAPETIATLHHALLRGIEVSFQLEEGEVLGEALPARDNRRAILIYEATEGGAGVLSRLVEDADALGRVVRAALNLMHFDQVDEAIAAGDAGRLSDHAHAACVRGCYRCLLSYYNQPDHELIDRTSDQAKQLLIDMARGQMVLKSTPISPRSDQDNQPADAWPRCFTEAGLPAPDGTAIRFADLDIPYVWHRYFVAAASSPLTAAAREQAEAKGWMLFELPESATAGVPEAMRELLVAN